MDRASKVQCVVTAYAKQQNKTNLAAISPL
jgi:hypothetical protein